MLAVTEYHAHDGQTEPIPGRLHSIIKNRDSAIPPERFATAIGTDI